MLHGPYSGDGARLSDYSLLLTMDGESPAPVAFTRPASRGPGTARCSWRPERARPPRRRPVGALQRKPWYVRPLHRPLLRGDVTTLAGWPSDLGRDVLCLLTSPLRWFRWP